MIILLQNNEKYFTYCTKIKQFVIHLHPFFEESQLKSIFLA